MILNNGFHGTIATVPALNDEDKRRLFEWGTDIFGPPGPLKSVQFRPADVHVLVSENGCAVSHVGLIRHAMNLKAREVVIGGIGAVVTHKQFQGKGLAARGMIYAVEYIRNEWHADFGLLFCRDYMIDYYRNLKWRLNENKVIVEQPSGRTVIAMDTMVMEFTEDRWPEENVELKSLPW